VSLKGAALIETEESLSNLQCLRPVIVVSMNFQKKKKHKISSDTEMNDAIVPQLVNENFASTECVAHFMNRV